SFMGGFPQGDTRRSNPALRLGTLFNRHSLFYRRTNKQGCLFYRRTNKPGCLFYLRTNKQGCLFYPTPEQARLLILPDSRTSRRGASSTQSAS
ncbi:MAG: hypothetical protein ACPGWR_23280, partial [Ardenticatenaceae bacterium]